MIGPKDVRAAARVLDGVAHRTPVVRSRTLGEHVVLKPECLQRAGAFKFRGAYNKISSLPPGTSVLAYSSGNHAQAVALAARLLGAHATILMPTDAPRSKLEATLGYGAEVVTYDRYAEDREALGAALAEERGLELVRPYDDPLVMAGAGNGGARAARGRRRRRHARRAGRRRRPDRRLRDDRQGARSAARRRRRARGGRRLAPLVRGGRAGHDRRSAHDRGRAPDELRPAS